MGPFAPGLYQATVRVKLDDFATPLDRQWIEWFSYTENSPEQQELFDTYNDTGRHLWPHHDDLNGQYHDYTLPKCSSHRGESDPYHSGLRMPQDAR